MEKYLSISRNDEKSLNGMNVRTFNECCIDASKISDPADLYDGLWYEGELTALYADTNLGKSILAVQIAEEVAKKGFRTLYVDLELSDKGIEKRSRDEETGKLHVFPDNLMRVTVDFSAYMASGEMSDDGLDMIDRIERVAREAAAQVLILDNITAICAGVESGETAVRLVNRLLALRNDNKWSVLFIAHTPKLDRATPLTRDSMAGSKRVISLIDSAFAIGESLAAPGQRYIKQTKCRMDVCKYHEGNVLVCDIVREDGLLKFKPAGTAAESAVLTPPKEATAPVDDEALRNEIRELRKEGYSMRDIAEIKAITYYRVQRLLQEINA